MSVDGQSIGRDVSIDFVVLGQDFEIEPAAVTSFDPKPVTTKLKSKGFDGVPRHGVVPDGWELSISFDRMDDAVDAWWAAVEAAYYNGQPTGTGTITETITNPDGSTSQYRYTNVTLVLDDPGKRAPDVLIQGTLSGMASKRLKII